MTDSKEQKWPVVSLLDQLRPDPGWILDKACFGSYSADIRVIVAALLAISGTSYEPEEGSQVQLAQCLRDLRKRVSFVVQRSRMHWPKNIPPVSGLLDRFIFEADYDERGPSGRSWHPKFAVIRWRRKDDKAVMWRAWIGSRNLTRDLSLDCGLLLCEQQSKGASSQAPGIATAVAALQKFLPVGYKPFNLSDLAILKKLQWALPHGAHSLSAHWLDGQKDEFPLKKGSYQEILVVSPFVDAKTMRRVLLRMTEKRRPKLLTSPIELQRECPPMSPLNEQFQLHIKEAAPDEGLPYEPPEAASGSRSESEQEIDRSDETTALHAKLIYCRGGRDKRLWLGSPNFTGRAWSRNTEFVAELGSTAQQDPWGPVIRNQFENATLFDPFSTDHNSQNDEDDLLETIRKRLAATLSCYQTRSDDKLTITSQEHIELESGVALSVGLPWQGFELNVWKPQHLSLSLGEASLAACSELLLFSVRSGQISLSWLMRVPFRPSLNDARDRAGILAYLGPQGFIRLISAELQPEAAYSSPPWDKAPADKDRANFTAWSHGDAPTLEGLLRLFLREPQRLSKVKRTLEMLGKEMELWEPPATESELEAHRQIASFDRLWRQVGENLRAASSDGA